MIKPYDERDIMFARMNYKEGSEIYQDFYNKKPELKEIDDTLKAMPDIGGEGTVMYNKTNSPMVDAAFKYLVGITEMKDYHYYSHRGRHIENYGDEIMKKHKYGIVFAVPMNKEMIMRAPKLSESIAVTKGYVEAATIGMVVSYYIRELGYDSRNHMDGNYLLVAPLVARDAGLGEFGRNGRKRWDFKVENKR